MLVFVFVCKVLKFPVRLQVGFVCHTVYVTSAVTSVTRWLALGLGLGLGLAISLAFASFSLLPSCSLSLDFVVFVSSNLCGY
jgi:hypothetical protein